MSAEPHGPRLSEQGHHQPEQRYFDAVGRPRKLAQGAMTAIQREFRKGTGTRELAERWGVSVSLILTICYHTPKGTGKRPKPEDKRPVVIQFDRNAVTASGLDGSDFD
jgi:hypothetical protein